MPKRLDLPDAKLYYWNRIHEIKQERLAKLYDCHMTTIGSHIKQFAERLKRGDSEAALELRRLILNHNIRVLNMKMLKRY